MFVFPFIKHQIKIIITGFLVLCHAYLEVACAILTFYDLFNQEIHLAVKFHLNCKLQGKN